MILRVLVMLSFLSHGLLSATCSQAQDTAGMVPSEHPDDFRLQGEYVTEENSGSKQGLQAIALGDQQFKIVIYQGGLPGAGWDQKPPRILEEEDEVSLQEFISSLGLKKVDRQSPTLGAKPPEGATVLFDGTAEKVEAHWHGGAKLSDDKLLIPQAVTKQNFQDFTLHLEFRTPFMPKARGQGRGNSGLYLQGRYEFQILDSFGLEGLDNEAGGIYQIRKPDLNMCLPPLTWQTYDVEFTAARFDEEGKKISNARATVRLNGVVIHQDIELPHVTGGSILPESAEPGPILLQDHNDPVRFQNIWIVPRDASKEASRPRIPGYERFHAVNSPSIEGGNLLINELGCAHCHAEGHSISSSVPIRSGPVLTDVGKRLHPEWITRFLKNPHETKPGTTMPGLFLDWEETEREQTIQALTNYLVGDSALASRNPNKQAIDRGEKLFHTVGCVACHDSQQQSASTSATSVPLIKLTEKYSLPALTEFLLNPHAVRPSGRMPALLQPKEADDIANYLYRSVLKDLPHNVHYTVYYGRWDQMPDFDQLEPAASGTCAGFDLSVAQRADAFGIRFEGYLNIATTEHYTFSLNADDGAVLSINGEVVLDNAGSPGEAKNEIQLKQGVHKVRLDYFEWWGDEYVNVNLSIPPWIPAQDFSGLITLNEDGTPVASRQKMSSDNTFQRNPSLITKGRQLFHSIGCANCHPRHDDVFSYLTHRKMSLPLDQLDLSSGCLAETPRSDNAIAVPDYVLTDHQRTSIKHALSKSSQEQQPADPQQVIHQTFTAFNCYACHERGGIGGPEANRNASFLSFQQGMGDEGRLPPSLNGVGDKLRSEWLKKVLNEGAQNRPYMLTRMPRYGTKNIGHLHDAFVAVDCRDEFTQPDFDDPLHRVKGIGRDLVGAKGHGCIKCHTFGDKRSTGIQAISLTSMSSRLREDWFTRYVFNPSEYRPGTRMPTGFPDGHSTIKDVYDGDPQKQLAAIWLYLSDGDQAGLPEGLETKIIELKPENEPIIYRNFIEGLSPRGIAVGYPENAHLGWDANTLSLRLLWHDRFIDASKHWVGRGDGKQHPLGDHLVSFEQTVPFAVLNSEDAAWPEESPRRQPGFRFRGYELNSKRQPTFRYDTPFASITDFPEPVLKNQKEGTFRRHLTLTPNDQAEKVYFRAAVGDQITPVDQGWQIDQGVVVRLHGGGEPLLRSLNKRQELLVPIDLTEKHQITLIQEILW